MKSSFSLQQQEIDLNCKTTFLILFVFFLIKQSWGPKFYDGNLTLFPFVNDLIVKWYELKAIQKEQPGKKRSSFWTLKKNKHRKPPATPVLVAQLWGREMWAYLKFFFMGATQSINEWSYCFILAVTWKNVWDFLNFTVTAFDKASDIPLLWCLWMNIQLSNSAFFSLYNFCTCCKNWKQFTIHIILCYSVLVWW